MAYTPDTATEIDSYQGNPALAIGQSGNLPFFPTMSPEVVNQFTAITDAYVKKKQKDYDQWQTNLTKAKNETIGMEGVYQSDIPEIQKKQSELEALLAKDPTVVAVGAERNNPNYKKFIELEKDLLYSKRLSEHHAELDKEYKKLSAQKAFQNEAFKDQYEKFKASPITERSPFVPIMDDDDALQTNLQRILNMEEYKNPIQGTVTPETDVNGVATGATVITNPYSYETDRILPNLVQYNRDIDYYKYDNGLGLSDEEKAMTRDEYHLEQLKKRIPQGTLQGKITRGTDFNTKVETSQLTWEERERIREQNRIEAEQRKIDNKEEESNTYPEVESAVAEVKEVFSLDPSKGKKINLPAQLKVMEGDIYDVTNELKTNNPNFYEEVVASQLVNVGGNSEGVATKVYMNVNPDKTKTFILGNDQAIDYNSKLSYNGSLDKIVKKRKIGKEYSQYAQEVGSGSNSYSVGYGNEYKPTPKDISVGAKLANKYNGFYNSDSSMYEFSTKNDAELFGKELMKLGSAKEPSKPENKTAPKKKKRDWSKTKVGTIK